MKKIFLVFTFIITAILLKAQRVDSIYFHLYTDSLKKGTYNYINVDGKLSNGRWRPLTEKEILFTSSSCLFSGNELIVPDDFKEEKIIIKAVLKTNPALWIERTVWIKRLPDPELLPSKDEMRKSKPKKNKR